MHKILERQLRRLKASTTALPGLRVWKEMLDQVDKAYLQADQDRYLLERSLAISSKEMQDLYLQQQRQSEEALSQSEGKYRSLFDNAFDSIFIIDVETRRILDVNQIAADRLGYTRDELLALHVDELNPPGEAAENYVLTQKLINEGSLVFERTHVRKEGSYMPVEVSSRLLHYDGRRIFQSFVRDITDRKRAEQELTRLATHDPLTNLPNRALFDDRLNHAVTLGKRNDKVLAVLFMDLDGFKAVNDAFGHKQGDRLLQTLSDRLVSTVRQSDTVARLGGDEFALLLESINHESEVIPVIEKIIKAVNEPFRIHNAEAFISCSIGVSLFPTDGTDPDTLIQNADRAMYLCKAEEANNYRFFTPAMKTQALERLELGNQLRQAIKRDEISIMYQPQIDSRQGVAIGLEALARWQHPALGLLLPETFVPLAEETGLIASLSDLLLRKACREIKALLDSGAPEIRLAVNLSQRDLGRANLIETITEALEETGFSPRLLELEVSENTIFHNMERSRSVLEQIKALGVRLAIDDFGVGSSTLSQLARLPFDTLKIDRQFASQLTSSPNEAAIVNGIVTIAKSLGVEVIAEGVENQAQLDFYESLGCHHIQGWLFAEAVPVDQVSELLRTGIKRPQLQMKIDGV